jgi:hypothetical protein
VRRHLLRGRLCLHLLAEQRNVLYALQLARIAEKSAEKKLGFSVSYAAEITAETWCDLIFFMLRRNLRLKSFEKLGFNVLLLQRNLL